MTKRLSDFEGHVYVTPPDARGGGSGLADLTITLDPSSADLMSLSLIVLGACAAFIIWSGSNRDRGSVPGAGRNGRATRIATRSTAAERFVERAAEANRPDT